MNEKTASEADKGAQAAKGAAEAPRAEGGPFHDDALLFFPGSYTRNEIEEAQSEGDAARRLGARHWSRLLYDPNAPWQGRTPYPPAPITPPTPGKKR